MAAPAVVGGTAVSSSFASPCPRLKSRPPIPPPTVRLSSRPRSRSLRLSACPPSRHPVAACLKSSPSLGLPKEEHGPSVDDSASPPPPPSKETTLDMKLPRRSLLVQFTCNSCGERTRRLINRVAYERGTVFVQCAGCLVHHKLIDNLNLVVEYDLRDDTDTLDPVGQDGELA